MKPGDLVKLNSEYESTPMYYEPKWTLPGIGSFKDGEVGTVLENTVQDYLGTNWVKILATDGTGWCSVYSIKVINETR